MSLRDPRKDLEIIIDERRGPIYRGGFPDLDKTQFPRDVSISTTPFPVMSPWTFLAGAIGNIVGSFVGGPRGNNQGVGQPISQQMPDLVEMMQREETNRLIRELLKTSREKKDKPTMESDLKRTDILNLGDDAFGGLLQSLK